MYSQGHKIYHEIYLSIDNHRTESFFIRNYSSLNSNLTHNISVTYSMTRYLLPLLIYSNDLKIIIFINYFFDK